MNDDAGVDSELVDTFMWNHDEIMGAGKRGPLTGVLGPVKAPGSGCTVG